MSTRHSQFSWKQNRPAFVAVVLVLALVAASGLAVAQQGPDASQKVPAAEKKSDTVNRAKAASGDKKPVKVEVSAEDRARVMKFASENHPELAHLLEQLEKSRPGEFARAARELTLQVQTLDRTRERSPARYQAQLETWKRDSEIRILMARWSRNQDPQLERQVRDLLAERRESRETQLKAEKLRMTEQLRKIEEQLAALSQPAETQIDREWDQLSKKATVRKSGEKKSPGQAAPAAPAGPKP